MTFPLWLAGIILCFISINRQIHVAHNKYHERFVTKWLLTIILICVTISSFLWSTLDTMFKGRLETVKLAKLYISLSAYPGAVLLTGTVSNLALLKYVELERQNSSIKQAHDSSLTKTIAMIFTIVVETFLTIIIFLNIATYSFIKSKDTKKKDSLKN